MGNNGKVELWGTDLPCPFTLRARIALKIKEVNDYKFEETLQPRSQLPKDNPLYEKIPVLIHRNRPIYGSLIIVQYVDAAWQSGHPILPSDPYDCAVARFWATYIDEKLYPAMKSLIKGAKKTEEKRFIKEIEEGMNRLKDVLQGKPFFGGHQIGYLDIAFGSFLGWLKVTEASIDMNLLHNDLSGWAARFRKYVQSAKVKGHDALFKNKFTDAEKLLLFG